MYVWHQFLVWRYFPLNVSINFHARVEMKGERVVDVNTIGNVVKKNNVLPHPLVMNLNRNLLP